MLLFLIIILFAVWYFFVRKIDTVCNDGDKPCSIGRCIKNKCTNECDKTNMCQGNYQCSDNKCVLIKPTGPVGKYCGSVSFLNITLKAQMNFPTNGKIDFSTSDAISITCNAEPFTMDGSLIMITDIGTQGDCVHDALSRNNVSVESITYSKETNQILLKANVKIFFTVPVSMTLSLCD